MKNLIITVLLSIPCLVFAVDLNKDGRDPKYVESIVNRSQKIVDGLDIADAKTAETVRNIIANRYFELNDIYEIRDTKIKEVKASSLEGAAREQALKAAEHEKEGALYRTHFAFPAALSIYLTEKQIEGVKDGMTYGVVDVTYTATIEMVPSLTDDEKKQIYAWLIEAREFAMDAENSTKKHEAFGKYKGRINNYLSQRGYDLTKEREGWYKRIEEQKKK